MLTYALVFVLILCCLELLLNYNEKARIMKRIPGPKDYFLVGNALAIMCSPVEIMVAARHFALNWKDGLYRFWMSTFAAINIFHPDYVEIITSNVIHNEKSTLYSLLKPWLADGLLLSKGTKWMKRRKILTPAFHFNILRQFFKVMKENSCQFIEKLNETVGQTVDIVPLISDLTLQTICETAMGTKLNNEASLQGIQYKQAIKDLVQVVFQRGTKIPYFFDFIFNFTQLAKKQKKLLKTVHKFTSAVIDDRMEYVEKYGVNLDDNANDDTAVFKKKRPVAMLDLLITASKEGLIDKQGIHEEVDTFMFEGHDTTAAGLVFSLMLLANHTDIQNKILAELNEIFEDSYRPIKVEDLSKMKYLECCIKESMRLYPPIHFISRNINESIKLGDHDVPAGVFCHIHIYDLHRREDFFPNPNDFIPERFLPENSAGRHPYAYIPFSAGPRNCIGQKFAMMEMKCVIATILRSFELIPVTRPCDIEYVADLVLRNNGPVELKFIKRIQNQ